MTQVVTPAAVARLRALADRLEQQLLTPDLYIEAWQETAAVAKQLTALEMLMRKALVTTAFPTQEQGEGTFRAEVGSYNLKAVLKKTRSIDETMLTIANEEFNKANDRPAGMVFDDLIKTKFDLVTGQYRKLDKDSSAFKAISRMIITKPGSPTLEVT